MNWKNLKNGKCPKCSQILKQEYLEQKLKCPDCDFSIGEEKLLKIISGKRPAIGNEEDNFSKLQNLGHKEVTEDFSDSPFLDIC